MKPKFDFAVGGQAVLEGVMMRSPHFYTVCVRNPKGALELEQKPFESVIARHKALNWPLLRGIVHLVESMKIGYRALDYSNLIFLEEDAPEQGGWLQSAMSLLSILFSLVFGLFLLKFLPLLLATQMANIWPAMESHYLLFNLVDGLAKLLVFLSYISLISVFKDIRRVFQYHGAEHKSIWTYEKGLPLTVEHARAQTRFHPRCGTSFIFVVILMSIVIYTFIPAQDGFLLQLASRVAVLPLVAGFSYELLKLSAKYQDHFAVRLFTLPGLFLQKLTTREPDDAQLEVALASLQASLDAEHSLAPIL